MSWMMSIALSRLPAVLSGEATSQPGLPVTLVEPLTTFVAIGCCVLVVWIIRRLARPAKLRLDNTPGRPNSLTPVHIIMLLLLWLGILTLISRIQPVQLHLAALNVAQGLWLVASLLVAARCFRMGLIGGLGLSMRHWFYDTARAILGYLAVIPLCVALLLISQYLLPKEVFKVHPLLETMRELPVVWRVVAIFSAVVMAPLAEEVFFRGIVQSAIRSYTHRPWTAILITSVFFASMHAFMPISVAPLFALAVVIGYNYERCGRLYPAILIHALFNAVNVATWMHDTGP